MKIIITLALVLNLGAAVAIDDGLSFSRTLLRAPNIAAFAIIDNGKAPTRWFTRNFIEPMLESYEQYVVYEPYNWGSPCSFDNLACFANKLRKYSKNETIFYEKFIEILKNKEAVDLFILSHGNNWQRSLSKNIPAYLMMKIRLVYNAGCGDGDQGPDWLDSGVSAYIGHGLDSCSPVFLSHFKTYWWQGLPLGEAVAKANAATVKELGHPLVSQICLKGIKGSYPAKLIKDTQARIYGDPMITIDKPFY